MSELRDTNVNGDMNVTGSISGGVTTQDVSTNHIGLGSRMHLTDTYTKGALYGLWELPAIQKGGDLNNYTIPGMYSIREHVIADEVANLPIKSAGILKVTNATGSFLITGQWVYIRQEYYPLSDFSKYGRIISTGTSGAFQYGKWQKVY